MYSMHVEHYGLPFKVFYVVMEYRELKPPTGIY